jgi:hypothetical protein
MNELQLLLVVGMAWLVDSSYSSLALLQLFLFNANFLVFFNFFFIFSLSYYMRYITFKYALFHNSKILLLLVLENCNLHQVTMYSFSTFANL